MSALWRWRWRDYYLEDRQLFTNRQGIHIPEDLDLHQQSYENLKPRSLRPDMFRCLQNNVLVPVFFSHYVIPPYSVSTPHSFLFRCSYDFKEWLTIHLAPDKKTRTLSCLVVTPVGKLAFKSEIHSGCSGLVWSGPVWSGPVRLFPCACTPSWQPFMYRPYNITFHNNYVSRHMNTKSTKPEAVKPCGIWLWLVVYHGQFPSCSK